MSSFMRVIHLAQALLSGYDAFHSYKAIVNLQTYEATTKKLAKWSDEVGKQLHKTRTTQATAALTILFSTLTSLTLGIKPEVFPSSVLYAAPPCLVIVVLLARSHVSNYWAPSDGKTVGVKVPLPNLDEYIKAQRATEEVLKVLQWVEWSWVGASLGAGMVGY